MKLLLLSYDVKSLKCIRQHRLKIDSQKESIIWKQQCIFGFEWKIIALKCKYLKNERKLYLLMLISLGLARQNHLCPHWCCLHHHLHRFYKFVDSICCGCSYFGSEGGAPAPKIQANTNTYEEKYNHIIRRNTTTGVGVVFFWLDEGAQAPKCSNHGEK